jgi:hypothetical protein
VRGQRSIMHSLLIKNVADQETSDQEIKKRRLTPKREPPYSSLLQGDWSNQAESVDGLECP